jgi:DNA-binding beta-propeller fold protein YncE
MRAGERERLTRHPVIGACLAALVAAVLGLGAFAPASASAAQLHAFSSSFGAPGSGAGQLALSYPSFEQQLEGPKPTAAGSGLAVDDQTGDIYVADTGNHRISEFAATGTFIGAFAADVGGAGIDLCTTSCSPGSSGHAPGQLQSPTFIAVDNDLAGPSHGDVYVADTAADVVSKFSAGGALLGAWGTAGQLDGAGAPGGPFGQIDGIAVDPTGDLWVQGGGTVFEFTESGSLLQELQARGGTQPTGIALDHAAHLYAFDGFPWGPLYRLTTGGVDQGNFGLGSRGEFFTGLAVDQSDDNVYLDVRGSALSAFSPGCSAFPCAPDEVVGEGTLHEAAGVAVDGATGTLYAAETATDEIDVFAATLEARTEAATGVAAASATLHGTVDPKAGSVIRCRFQYGTSTGYGTEVPCLGVGGEEVGTQGAPITSPSAVHADLTSLAGESAYHFRLRVSDAAAEALSSEDEAFSTAALATIDSTSVTELTATTATLNASIDPHGVAATKYRFQWGPCATPSTCATSPFPESVPAPPGSEIPTGSSPVPVAAPIAGLTPDSVYHLRVFVSDENGTLTGPERTFVFATTIPAGTGCPDESLRLEDDSTALPDCRAYELVTPAQKNGSLIGALLFNNVPPQIADDGGALVAPAIQCFSDALSCVAARFTEGEPFLFSRTGSGWSDRALTLPASQFAAASSWRFDADSGSALFSAPTQPGGEDDWYARAAAGGLTDLGPLWEAGQHVLKALEPEPVMSDAGFDHVLYQSQEPLWSFDEGVPSGALGSVSANGLYEYPSAAGTQPQLVAVSGGIESRDLIGTCGSELAGKGSLAQSFGSLSADGRTTYFQVKPCATGSRTNAGDRVPVLELFARIDGEGPAARTIAISEPGQLAQADPACSTAGCIADTSDRERFRDARFEGASSDGGRVFFTSTQQLTDDAGQDPDPADDANAQNGCSLTVGAAGCNLYLFEDPQEEPQSGIHLIDVSAGDTSGLGPAVRGALAISSDGTHVYFVAAGVLSEAPNALGEAAAEGADNLYLYERDAAHPGGRTTFVTRLSDADATDWRSGLGHANVTPDGRCLVFESSRGLTPDARAEGPAQIYRYDAASGTLARISFGRRGFDGDGNLAGPGADASIALARDALLQRVAPIRPDPTMADDGSRIFFQSPVALTPNALAEAPTGGEGDELAQNVYEWEAAGVGTCVAGETRGCVSLISDGSDTSEKSMVLENAVELLGVDRTGENVFFATASQLNWEDSDSQRDYYDARVEGGFAPPPAQLICQGDACKGQGTAAGSESAPASATADGPDEGPNHPRIKCKKGFVRKGGRCVKQAKHSKKHKAKKKRHARSNRRAGK